MEALALGPGLVCCDLTLGGGGHLGEMARRIEPGGVIVAVDRDLDAIARAKKQMLAVSRRVEIRLVHGSFGHLKSIMARQGLTCADRSLLDLGVSSDQIDDPGRGFSFLHDGPLDARQDRSQELTAAIVVNTYPADELERILREYGEERYAKRIAQAIVERRREQPFSNTLELAEVITATVPGSRGRVHPATRTFQAIRMEVGDEVGELTRCLPQAAELLSDGGRMAIITFHSVEDRVVKQALRPYGRHAGRTDWQLVRRGRVMRPSAEEVRGNPRSRSAKLRVFEKVRVAKA